MKRIWNVTLTLLVVLAGARVFAGEPCGCCAPTCGCAPACCDSCEDRWYFRIERTEQKCIIEVPTEKWYATPSKVVCEKKECNCKEKVTCTEIIPLCCKPGCKKEEKVKVCTTVHMHCGPCMD